MSRKYHAGIAISMLLMGCSMVTAQTTQEDWQKKAVEDYPALGVQGSEFNVRYVQRVRSLRNSDASFFENPRWPYTLAEEMSKKSIIPGLENIDPVGPASSKTTYIDGQRVDIIDSKDLETKGTQGQKICFEGVVVQVSQRKLASNNQFLLKLAPNIFCEFSLDTFIARNRSFLPNSGSYSSSDAKVVIENNAVSVYAPTGNKKKAIKVGELFKAGDKVVIYGQYSGSGSVGIDQGLIIKDCVTLRPGR